jgi:hypothetical protein
MVRAGKVYSAGHVAHNPFPKTGSFSKEATAFRSLVYVKMGQPQVNCEWLKEHDEIEVLKLYLEDEIVR